MIGRRELQEAFERFDFATDALEGESDEEGEGVSRWLEANGIVEDEFIERIARMCQRFAELDRAGPIEEDVTVIARYIVIGFCHGFNTALMFGANTTTKGVP